MDGSQGGKKILYSKFNQTYNSIMYVLHEQYTSNVFLRKHFKLIEVHAVFSLNIYEHTVALATSIRYNPKISKALHNPLRDILDAHVKTLPLFSLVFSPSLFLLLLLFLCCVLGRLSACDCPLLCGFAPNHLKTPTILCRVRLPYLSTLNGHSKATCLTSVTAHGPQTSTSSDGISSSILMISGQMEREKRTKRKEKRKTVGERELEMIKTKRVSARAETRAFKTEAGGNRMQISQHLSALYL